MLRICPLSFRRRQPRRNAITVVLISLFLDFLITIHTYRLFNDNLTANTVSHVEQLPTSIREQKVFIAAQFWSSADILRDHWQDALLKLIDALGADNIYLSIIATHGHDDTTQILHRFDNEQLAARNVARTIVLDPKTHDDEIKIGAFDASMNPRPGWIYTSDSSTSTPGRKELRRIPYLAGIRNRSLAPLATMQQERGIRFDKILFLGDVIFKPSDVLTLLATNGGSYDAACSIDYRLDKRFYDTFVLRDINFKTVASRHFPMFQSTTSRNAILKGLPAPVTSCWNGMVVADAAQYYQNTKQASEPMASSAKTTPIMQGLRFRSVPDTLAAKHVEASESCLIHADAFAQGSISKGLFLNPAVRVGYMRWGFKTTSYDDVHIGPRKLGWITLGEYVQGIWINRRARWWPSNLLDGSRALVRDRVAQWKAEGVKIGEQRTEMGEYCLIDEMQVLTAEGKGWKHIGGQAEY